MLEKAHKIIVKKTKKVEVVSKKHEVVAWQVGELERKIKNLSTSHATL
jgi:hypothetical protein